MIYTFVEMCIESRKETVTVQGRSTSKTHSNLVSMKEVEPASPNQQIEAQ